MAQLEVEFWKEFYRRVRTTLANRLQREVVLPIRGDAAIADELTSYFPKIVEHVKAYRALHEEYPMPHIQLPTLASETVEEPVNVFRRRGSGWEIRFKGREAFYLAKDGGCSFLQILLGAPGKKFKAPQLEAIKGEREGHRKPGSTINLSEALATAPLGLNHDAHEAVGNSDAILDRDYVRDLRRHLKANQKAQEQAQLLGQLAQLEDLKESEAAMKEQLKRHVGPGGRLKNFSDVKRTHDRVQQAIGRALNKIRGQDASLYRHLENAVKRKNTNMQFSYEPESETIWIS